MGKLVDAVQADLDRWGPAVAETALAASALDLARRLDTPDVTPTPASMLHAQLRATLADLQKLAPDQSASDEIDDLEAKRKERRSSAGLG
ncbi:hypothetical protein [Actinomadura sp. HBU206391]|uniref:hypothetical protein n=1 Tax=Actinomadura sp. HBU206391 TaxID=2731692 RepID=UPI00165086CE|nr:hypothetical protein [Actinomadura sp. HBU206391]MBC6458412.1 hypothetical protein [Actinomadura sp. HBU206391]